jgi:hypothetical protein
MARCGCGRSPVERQRGSGTIELVEVALQELIHRGLGSRVSPLLNLTNQPVASGTRPSVGPGSGGDDLDQVMSALAHRVNSGIDADSQRPVRQLVDAASNPSCATPW